MTSAIWKAIDRPWRTILAPTFTSWYKTAVAALAKVPVRMTVSEFLQWDADDDQRYELVDGEPHATAPASAIHAFLQNELGRMIGNHLRQRMPGCEVLANPGVIPRLYRTTTSGFPILP